MLLVAFVRKYGARGGVTPRAPAILYDLDPSVVSDHDYGAGRMDWKGALNSQTAKLSK